MLQASKVGAGHISEGAAANARRTSSSMLADPLTLAANPRLSALVTALQTRAWRLLHAGAVPRTSPGPCTPFSVYIAIIPALFALPVVCHADRWVASAGLAAAHGA